MIEVKRTSASCMQRPISKEWAYERDPSPNFRYLVLWLDYGQSFSVNSNPRVMMQGVK